jgi:hypothetical protein
MQKRNEKIMFCPKKALSHKSILQGGLSVVGQGASMGNDAE